MAEKIRHYEILEPRVGEEAIVYKAWDPNIARHVAIKEPLPHLLKDRSFLDSFMEEGRRLASINDENVVKCYHLIPPGEIDDKCYLILEYVGQSLEDLLKRGPLDVSAGRTILRDTLGGLKAIHQAGLIHANLRPGNILITPEGRAKITDLRLAWVREHKSTIALSSAKYLPHEILAGDGQIGPWSDLYSLGCVAYEMFLGSTRFEAQFLTPFERNLDEREIMDPRYREWHCDLSHRAKPLIEIDDRVPESLSSIVARLMEKAIDQRYQDADQALSDLESGRVKKPVVVPGDERDRKGAGPKEGMTRPVVKEESTFWQDFLIVFGVALLGLVIVAVMIKLS